MNVAVEVEKLAGALQAYGIGYAHVWAVKSKCGTLAICAVLTPRRGIERINMLALDPSKVTVGTTIDQVKVAAFAVGFEQAGDRGRLLLISDIAKMKTENRPGYVYGLPIV